MTKWVLATAFVVALILMIILSGCIGINQEQFNEAMRIVQGFTLDQQRAFAEDLSILIGSVDPFWGRWSTIYYTGRDCMMAVGLWGLAILLGTWGLTFIYPRIHKLLLSVLFTVGAVLGSLGTMYVGTWVGQVGHIYVGQTIVDAILGLFIANLLWIYLLKRVVPTRKDRRYDDRLRGLV